MRLTASQGFKKDIMALSHIKQTLAGREKFEGHQTDMFKCTFIFPQSLVGGTPNEVISEHILSVSGFNNPGIEILEQDQGATRLFASNSIKTRQDISFAMTLNYNLSNELYIYEKFKELHKLISNYDTFEKSLKRDYMVDVVVEHFLRNGEKVYERLAKNGILNGELGSGLMDGDIGDSGLKQLDFTISFEYFDEIQFKK